MTSYWNMVTTGDPPMTSEPPKKQSQFPVISALYPHINWWLIIHYVLYQNRSSIWNAEKSYYRSIIICQAQTTSLDGARCIRWHGWSRQPVQRWAGLGTHCCAMLWSESAVSIRAACHALCPGQKGSAQQAQAIRSYTGPNLFEATLRDAVASSKFVCFFLLPHLLFPCSCVGFPYL